MKMEGKSSGRRAQVWFTDFIVGVLIFVAVIFIYYEYAHSTVQDPNEAILEFMMDAKAISNPLMTAGSPPDWNVTDVMMIGLTDGKNRIVQKKLDMFANMSYAEMRSKLRTPYEFYLFFSDADGNKIFLDGKSGLGKEPSAEDVLVSVRRLVIYNHTIAEMVVQVWQ